MVKAYGEHYDHLVEPSSLTKEEKQQLNSFRKYIKNQIIKDNITVQRKIKINFLDYFDKKDHSFVLEIIEEYKKINHIYYKVLVKAYGEHYDYLVEPSPLTNKEKMQLNNFRSSIKNKIAKGNTTIQRTMKINFLDYFEEKDKDFALEIIEQYKRLNHVYYKTLVKAYGKYYDHLIDISLLTKQEKSHLRCLIEMIRNKIKTGDSVVKIKEEKISFLDYFDKKDQPQVLQIIEEYKKLNHAYYKVLVKAYGEHYDHLVEPSLLTKKEKEQLHRLRNYVEKQIVKDEITVQTKMKRNSFFDYFEEKDYSRVLEIIEKYKKLNHIYYKVLVKAYGEHYDHLVEPSPLTKEEKQQLNSFRQYIKNQIIKGNITVQRKTKRNSFLDYFEEKDQPFVLKIIEEYKKLNHVYYKALVKAYGEHYDHLVEPDPLTKDEKIQLEYLKKIIKNRIVVIHHKLNDSFDATEEGLNFNLQMSYLYRKFPNLKQEKELDLIVLTSFIDKRKSVEAISYLTKIPTKQIDNILLRHLYLFSYKMPELIDDILKRENYTVSQITSFNLMKIQEPFLNDKEKKLLYDKVTKLYNLELQKTLHLEDEIKIKKLK